MLHKPRTMCVHDSREVKGSRQGSFARTFASLTFAPSRVLFGWSAIYASVEEELFSLSPFLPHGSWLFRMVFSSDNSWLLSVLCRVMKYSTSVFIPEAFWKHSYSVGFHLWLPGPLCLLIMDKKKKGGGAGGRKRLSAFLQEALCNNRNTLQKAGCRV